MSALNPHTPTPAEPLRPRPARRAVGSFTHRLVMAAVLCALGLGARAVGPGGLPPEPIEPDAMPPTSAGGRQDHIGQPPAEPAAAATPLVPPVPVAETAPSVPGADPSTLPTAVALAPTSPAVSPGALSTGAAAAPPNTPVSPALPAAPAGTTPPAARPTAPTGLDCLIQPSQTVQVGTASAGVVETVRVERGDMVRKGQILLQLDSRVEVAALAMAREKAEQLGEMKATKGASDLAQRELQRAADLVKDNYVSRTYYDRQRAELEVAAGRGQQAEERRRLAERELRLASAQLAQRTVVAPIDGVVVERLAAPGEYVEQKPVLRIAQVDPLRVDVLVPAPAFGQIEVGAVAHVVPELLSRERRPARVVGIDRVIDAASNTFRVRLELPNPGNQLPPGLRCKAELNTVQGLPITAAAGLGAR